VERILIGRSGPDRLSASDHGALRSIPGRSPVLNPSTVTTQFVGTLTLTGKNFRAPATVELISATGQKTALTPVTVGSTTQITAPLNVATLALAPGAYVVRVTNTDQSTYFDFSALAVTNPAGNLSPWAAAESSMTTARRRHAMVAGRVSQAEEPARVGHDREDRRRVKELGGRHNPHDFVHPGVPVRVSQRTCGGLYRCRQWKSTRAEVRVSARNGGEDRRHDETCLAATLDPHWMQRPSCPDEQDTYRDARSQRSSAILSYISESAVRAAPDPPAPAECRSGPAGPTWGA
jgi:hypothetical protein